MTDDIDMSTLKSAVPPIGTTDNPFVGYLDGNYRCISNLWISTDETNWEIKPLGYNPSLIGTDVGVFGSIIKVTN